MKQVARPGSMGAHRRENKAGEFRGILHVDPRVSDPHTVGYILPKE